MSDYDVVVVGGGCAGAAASFFLQHYSLGRKMKSLLIERLEGAKFSKYHRMCGEAVSRAAFRGIRPIRPTAVLNEINKVEEHWPGGAVLRSGVKGYVIDRPRFLEDIVHLYEHLGGERAEDAVIEIAPSHDQFLLKCSSGETIRTRYLVGADGAHSLVRKRLFKDEPPHVFMMEQFVVQKDLSKDTISFFQDERYHGGYRWEFPYGDLAKVGFPRETDSLEGKVIERQRRDIPVGGLARIVSGNACLVGDAAAQANALTGGGIRVALLAGKQAAKAIVNSDLARYESWWRNSHFSSPKFLIAQKQKEKMTNEDFKRAVQPFKRGFSLISYLGARRKKPEFRNVYAAYINSGKYGW